jgi:hypothetical protein
MKKIEAIDIELSAGVASTGVAYFRIDPKFRDFLNVCDLRHDIIGFEWDGETLNFGVILGTKQKAAANGN